MFDFFRRLFPRKPAPPASAPGASLSPPLARPPASSHFPERPEQLPGNPGVAIEAEVAFANGERTWSETIDIVALAGQAMASCGQPCRSHRTWLEHPSGLMISPLLVISPPNESNN